ncbi:unnamed protein product [Adineta steineri]|uniref:F-box domain-containing protein n=1 Tax=Adineta steineri TaxID=433720 RepID=A0A814NJN8_9BILA|nr:unnamed protein product [Adineta steineri]
MSDNILKENISITYFDYLPTEIILHIFDYLSSIDIIYSFFYLNQRLQNLLITQKHYIHSLQLPSTNLYFWQQILLISGSYIQSLIIVNDYLTLSLDLFPNLTSIIIKSSFDFIDGQLKLILEHKQFQKLNILKIKDGIVSKWPNNQTESDDEKILFKKVFSEENNLQIFEYLPLFTKSNCNDWTVNIYIHSLTLNLLHFKDIFNFIKYVPNLIYLNIQSLPPFSDENEEDYKWNHFITIQLKEFHLKLNEQNNSLHRCSFSEHDFNKIISTIQLFSSSLIILSLNFQNFNMNDENELPFNGIKLENQLLKSMIKLKNFYLYAETYPKTKDVHKLLSTFQAQFWFDHNWSIGLHNDHRNTYIYSLPFHFNELHNFIHTNQILSNNDQLLKNNTHLWYNITSLGLSMRVHKNFEDIFRFIKINMPKLSSIRFFGAKSSSDILCLDKKTIKKNHVTLNNVTTVSLECIHMEQLEEYLIYTLPNLKNLILTATELPLIDSELALIFNKRIQRLEVSQFFYVKILADISYHYFSNLKELNLTYYYTFNVEECQDRPNVIRKILENFVNLRILSIYVVCCDMNFIFDVEDIFKPIIRHLDRYQIKDKYEIKCYGQYLRFVKKLLF